MDIKELNSFNNPPELVKTVVLAVCILLGIENPDWSDCKRLLADVNLLKYLIEYDKDNVPQAILTKLRKYTRTESFDPEHISRTSVAAASVAKWVLGIDYHCERKALHKD